MKRVGCFFITLLLSCSNKWVSQKDPSSIQQRIALGDRYFDEMNYEKAAYYYQSIVNDDSDNSEVRTRLAYAYLGLAKLSLFDVITGFTKDKNESTELSEGSKGLTKVLSVLGLTATEKQALLELAANQPNILKNLNDFRKSSPKLTSLHKGYQAICRTIPTRIYDAVIQGDSKLAKLYKLNGCLRTQKRSYVVKESGLFAAVILIMAEASALYQMVFDANDDGEMDLMVKANESKAKIDSINSSPSSDPATALENMSKLSAALEEMKDLSDTINGEMISLTSSHFGMASEMLKNMPGIDPSIAEQLNASRDKFAEVKTKLNAYTAQYSAENSSSEEQQNRSELEQSLSNAKAKLATNIASLPNTPENQQKIAAACAQMSSVEGAFGTAGSGDKIAGCP